MAMGTQKEDRGWNLYRRSDGQWVLSYRVAPGRWKETRIPRQHHTDKQCERYALAWLAEWHKQKGTRPVLPESAGDEPTIRSLADKWHDLQDKNPKCSPATRNQHKTCLNIHVLAYPEVADAPIPELGSATLRKWLREVRDNGKVTSKWEREDGRLVRKLVRGGPLAPYTCRNVVNSLTAFFDDCMAEEWVELAANPMRHPGVRKEVPEAETLAGRHTIVHFSRPVAERLLTSAATPEWRRVRTLLALTSGMAEGELSGLRWDDVDLEATIPLVRVTKSLAQKGADGWATLAKTKTENRVRILPVHSLAVRALRAWKSAGWARWVGHAPKPTDFLFPNPDGQAWRPDMPVMLRADLLKAGLPDHYEGHPFTAHATRRSFATWLAEAGVDKETRDRLMGHAAGSVGERHYTATILGKLQAAVECIRLDLSTGKVIELPVRSVAGGSGHQNPQQTDGPTATFTAGLTADRGKPLHKTSAISPERDTGLEPATFGLGSGADGLHDGAPGGDGSDTPMN